MQQNNYFIHLKLLVEYNYKILIKTCSTTLKGKSPHTQPAGLAAGRKKVADSPCRQCCRPLTNFFGQYDKSEQKGQKISREL
jgi:hypothetical protein